MLACQKFSNKSILFHQRSDFQSILVFRSAQYGNVLVLDGVIQLTERDEASYHEMMVHLPLCSHENLDGKPLSVLIVGGGDGGALREVCRYDDTRVQKVTVLDIDPMVVEVAKTYFAATLATCFDDPRVDIVHEDAAAYLRDESRKDTFDIIIGDTSDPVGPAKSLFQPAFYESMYGALKMHGIICVQAECFWIHLNLISDLVACCEDMFDQVAYAWTMVPTCKFLSGLVGCQVDGLFTPYDSSTDPCGQIGFVLAGKQRERSFPKPAFVPDFLDDLKWYSPAMHRASMTLPPFVTRCLRGDAAARDRGDGGEDDGEGYEEEEGYRCFLVDSPQCLIL